MWMGCVDWSWEELPAGATCVAKKVPSIALELLGFLPLLLRRRPHPFRSSSRRVVLSSHRPQPRRYCGLLHHGSRRPSLLLQSLFPSLPQTDHTLRAPSRDDERNARAHHLEVLRKFVGIKARLRWRYEASVLVFFVVGGVEVKLGLSLFGICSLLIS